MKIVAHAFLTLDGVVQAGGGPEEDRDGGFEHGGWQSGHGLGDVVREWEEKTEALLLGRRTYEIWSQSWGMWDEDADGLVGELNRWYNRVPKYVASRTLTTVDWANSHLLGSDVPAAVAALKAQPGGEIRVWGSTQLVRTLAEHDLIDVYRLALYPIVLGSGKRLFREGFPRQHFTVTGTQVTPTGVVISEYERERR